MDSEKDVQDAVTVEVSKDASAEIDGINYDEIDCSYEEASKELQSYPRSTLDDIERQERVNGNDPEFAGDDVIPVASL